MMNQMKQAMELIRGLARRLLFNQGGKMNRWGLIIQVAVAICIWLGASISIVVVSLPMSTVFNSGQPAREVVQIADVLWLGLALLIASSMPVVVLTIDDIMFTSKTEATTWRARMGCFLMILLSVVTLGLGFAAIAMTNLAVFVDTVTLSLDAYILGHPDPNFGRLVDATHPPVSSSDIVDDALGSWYFRAMTVLAISRVGIYWLLNHYWPMSAD